MLSFKSFYYRVCTPPAVFFCPVPCVCSPSLFLYKFHIFFVGLSWKQVKGFSAAARPRCFSSSYLTCSRSVFFLNFLNFILFEMFFEISCAASSLHSVMLIYIIFVRAGCSCCWCCCGRPHGQSVIKRISDATLFLNFFLCPSFSTRLPLPLRMISYIMTVAPECYTKTNQGKLIAGKMNSSEFQVHPRFWTDVTVGKRGNATMSSS